MADRHLLRKRLDIAPDLAFPVDSAQVIEVGDLVWLNTDDLRPASSFTYASTLAITQQNFRDQFVGVAMTASDSGETDDVTVYFSGVYEFDCAAATFEPGDLVGVDDNAAGDTLLDQQVIGVSNANEAIGRAWRRYGSNTTRVLVNIMPYIRRVDAV